MSMKDFYGFFVKEGDTVLYTSLNQYSGRPIFKQGVIETIIDHKAKIKGVVRKRTRLEIISQQPYKEWLKNHPEYAI